MEESENEEDLVARLDYAAAARNIREVEYLIKAGIDPSTPQKRNGCSPLHTAAVLESPSGPEIVSRMLFYGADPDVRTPTGLSPLHIAAMWGRYETINVLLDNGADISKKDDDDMSALDYAEDADKNRKQCIDALTRYRLNPKRSNHHCNRQGGPNKYFLTKSRISLDKILGGHVDFSTFLSDDSSILCNSPVKNNSQIPKFFNSPKQKQNLSDSEAKKKISLIKNVNNVTGDNKILPKKTCSLKISNKNTADMSTQTGKMADRPTTPTYKNNPKITPLSPNVTTRRPSRNDKSHNVLHKKCVLTDSTNIVKHHHRHNTEILSRLGEKPYDDSDFDALEDMMTDVSELNLQSSEDSDYDLVFSTPATHLKTKQIDRSRMKIQNKENVFDETLFHSCNDETLLNVAQSTMLEEFLLLDSIDCGGGWDSSVLRDNLSNHSGVTSLGYSGDISQSREFSRELMYSSVDDTFCSVPTCPQSPRKMTTITTESTNDDDEVEGNERKELLPLNLQRSAKEESLFVPSPSYSFKREGQDIINKNQNESKVTDNVDSCGDGSLKKPPYDDYTGLHNVRRSCGKCTQTDTECDIEGVIRPSAQDKEKITRIEECNENDEINKKGELKGNDKEEERDERQSELDGDEKLELLLTEETVNYSNKSVSELIEYYEDNTDALNEFDIKEVSMSESPLNTPKNSHFVVVNCRQDSLTPTQRRSIDELSTITVLYDWKDISQLQATEELQQSLLVIPQSIQTLSNTELRQQLLARGEKPGPISETTRNVYQRHLTRLESNPDHKKQGMDNQLWDYTTEMRQMLLGITTISKERGDELEQEMAFTFQNPEKHTWREGTQKTSFNYILLDPRVTKNLADRFETMPFLDQFSVFISAIFYIGKGKKSRPYEHFHEAVKYERNESKTKSPSKKVSVILDIWQQGYGVAAIHVFHSVIPVEAYTREACMIEAMSLSRLTNAKHGDAYGPAASWPLKKKRQLGIHLLVKAMKIYLIEGEKQIKQKDIVK